MKITVLLTLVVMLACTNSFGQGLLFTKSGDTIRYERYEDSYPNMSYWLPESTKPVKIKMENIKSRIDQPVYVIDKNDVDDYTGELSRLTKTIAIGISGQQSGPFSMNLMAALIKISDSTKSNYYLKLWSLIDLGCGGAKGNYIMIKFKSKDVVKLEDDKASLTCKAGALSVYSIPLDFVDKIRTSEIVGIRVKQSKGVQDFDIVFPEALIKSMEIIDRE